MVQLNCLLHSCNIAALLQKAPHVCFFQKKEHNKIILFTYNLIFRNHCENGGVQWILHIYYN